MTTLDELRSLVRDFQTQHDLDKRLLAIYRLGVEDGAEAALMWYGSGRTRKGKSGRGGWMRS